MKDVSYASSRPSRNIVYPKKRPSPSGGVSKSRGRSSPCLPSTSTRRHSVAAKAEQLARKQRQAQIERLHKQGIYIEEEYREEICAYMRDMERSTLGCMSSMDQQPEIKWHMRPCLVEFLIEVHFAFRLRPETLYLTLNIIDRYVSRRVVYIKHYQLVGCAALWIAAKFEDAKDRVPTVQDLVQVCRDTYDEQAFIQMEYHVLETIQWTLGHPTAEAWLRIVLCSAYVEDKETEDHARFLMETTLFYREFIRFVPSSVAIAALTLARVVCGKPRQIFEETEEILEIVEAMDHRLATTVSELSETLLQKYAYAFYSKASTNTVKWYLAGGRFSREEPLLEMPATPTRSPMLSNTPPLSASSTSSDMSDDIPQTPLTPFAGEAYAQGECDNKENGLQAFAVSKQQPATTVPEQFLPYDYVNFGRQALSTLNHLPSPRAAAVS